MLGSHVYHEVLSKLYWALGPMTPYFLESYVQTGLLLSEEVPQESTSLQRLSEEWPYGCEAAQSR
jgi:hypothetical protein